MATKNNTEVYAKADPQVRINFQKLLDERGMSQREFARRTGVGLETVRTFANGTMKRVPIDFLGKACRELNVGISDLIDHPTRR